jgi:hypothetical protein
VDGVFFIPAAAACDCEFACDPVAVAARGVVVLACGCGAPPAPEKMRCMNLARIGARHRQLPLVYRQLAPFFYRSPPPKPVTDSRTVLLRPSHHAGVRPVDRSTYRSSPTTAPIEARPGRPAWMCAWCACPASLAWPVPQNLFSSVPAPPKTASALTPLVERFF